MATTTPRLYPSLELGLCDPDTYVRTRLEWDPRRQRASGLPPTLGIFGACGSGKTTLLRQYVAELAGAPVVLVSESFHQANYPDQPELRRIITDQTAPADLYETVLAAAQRGSMVVADWATGEAAATIRQLGRLARSRDFSLIYTASQPLEADYGTPGLVVTLPNDPDGFPPPTEDGAPVAAGTLHDPRDYNFVAFTKALSAVGLPAANLL